MSEITAKGSNFLGLLRAAETLHGADAVQRALTNLPNEISSSLSYGQILAVGWYPVRWYAELHRALGEALSGGPELSRALGRQATGADFAGLHRVLISLLSTQTVFAQTHRLMGLYWKGGTIERVEVERSRARLRFIGWPGFTRLIWEDLMGSMEAILDICGAANIRCLAKGSLDDVEDAEFALRWS